MRATGRSASRLRSSMAAKQTVVVVHRLLATPSHHRLVTKKCPPRAEHNSRLKVFTVIDPSPLRSCRAGQFVAARNVPGFQALNDDIEGSKFTCASHKSPR